MYKLQLRTAQYKLLRTNLTIYKLISERTDPWWQGRAGTSLDVGRPANKCDSKRLDSVREQIRGEQTSKHKEQTEQTSPLEMDLKHPGPCCWAVQGGSYFWDRRVDPFQVNFNFETFVLKKTNTATNPN